MNCAMTPTAKIEAQYGSRDKENARQHDCRSRLIAPVMGPVIVAAVVRNIRNERCGSPSSTPTETIAKVNRLKPPRIRRKTQR
jgi:hypothetical protein